MKEGSNKNELKSNKPILGDEKLDSNTQRASDQNKKKTYKCGICQYYSSQRGNLTVHIASVHEEKKSFKCEICNYTCSTVASLEGGQGGQLTTLEFWM